MASSTDFKVLFEKYQEHGIKQGISIVKYCPLIPQHYYKIFFLST